MGCYSKAFKDFEIMLSKLERSTDPHMRGAPIYQYYTIISFD